MPPGRPTTTDPVGTTPADAVRCIPPPLMPLTAAPPLMPPPCGHRTAASDANQLLGDRHHH